MPVHFPLCTAHFVLLSILHPFLAPTPFTLGCCCWTPFSSTFLPPLLAMPPLPSPQVDASRRLGVMANADTPEDAKVARANGAQGIGLCRTEHMFFSRWVGGDQGSGGHEAVVQGDSNHGREGRRLSNDQGAERRKAGGWG